MGERKIDFGRTLPGCGDAHSLVPVVTSAEDLPPANMPGMHNRGSRPAGHHSLLSVVPKWPAVMRSGPDSRPGSIRALNIDQTTPDAARPQAHPASGDSLYSELPSDFPGMFEIGKLHLLIVEDVPEDAFLAERELERAGIVFESGRVDNERGFVRYLNKVTPDAILADFVLPQFTALDALRILRQRGAEIPFILVTGSQSEQVAVECMKAGADDYVLKTSLKRLPTALLNAIAKRKAERAQDEANRSLKAEIAAHLRTEENLQKAQERLETLSHRLLEAHEAERRSIARELHDEIGQALTAVKIVLQSVQQNKDPDAVKAFVQDGIEIVNRATDQVRTLALDLRPSILDDLGIVSALRWYIDRTSQRAGIKMQFVSPGVEGRFDNNLETTCFRVAQEALTNIIRHARAKKVEIRLERAGMDLTMTIRDDGVGFNPDQARERAIQGGSLGLLGMQERVALAGGTLEITSAPNEGTVLTARFLCAT